MKPRTKDRSREDMSQSIYNDYKIRSVDNKTEYITCIYSHSKVVFKSLDQLSTNKGKL